MKNKKAHIIVLVTTACLILFLIILIIYGYLTRKDELSIGSIVLNIVLVLWLGTFPISFYTCWRIVCIEEKEYNGFINHLIYAFRGPWLSLVFGIPLLLSPFLIFDYCSMLKEDLRKSKWESNFK